MNDTEIANLHLNEQLKKDIAMKRDQDTQTMSGSMLQKCITDHSEWLDEEIYEIIDCFHKLNKEQQAILIFYVQYGYELETIAIILNCPARYVKWQLILAKRRLRKTNPQKWLPVLQNIFAIDSTHPCQWVPQVSKNFEAIRIISNENKQSSEVKQAQPLLPLFYTCQSGKLLAVIAAVLTLSLTMVIFFTIRPDFHQKLYDDYSTIYKNLFGETELKAIEQMTLPSYLPSGYVFAGQVGELYVDMRTETLYQKDSKEILMQQSLKNLVIGLDTKANHLRRVRINHVIGYIIKNQECNTLVWSDDNYLYLLKSNIEVKELIKIANSCKQKKRKRLIEPELLSN